MHCALPARDAATDLVLHQLRGEKLERDFAAETRIFREINLSHPAGAERAKNFVSPDGLANQLFGLILGQPRRRDVSLQRFD